MITPARKRTKKKEKPAVIYVKSQFDLMMEQAHRKMAALQKKHPDRLYTVNFDGRSINIEYTIKKDKP